MDMLKFLKRKKRDNIEVLLKKAADKPSYRDEFYRQLLTAKLVIITKENPGAPGYVTLQKDTEVEILTFDDGSIPVFTSSERIFDKSIIKEQVPFLECTGKDLFNFVKSAKLMLNPYSDYGKELLPDEIASLLDGSIFTNPSKQIVIQKDTEVLIGEPTKYPDSVVSALKTLFVAKTDVTAAYVAWIHDPSSDVPPHYIFAVETQGDWRSLSNEAGSIANEILGGNQIIDFMQLSDRGGINDYFKKSSPFYKK
jgi:hypothetical protein